MNLSTPLLGFLMLSAAGSAHAAFVATITQVGNDVVLTGAGTININGLTQDAGTVGGSVIIPGSAIALSGLDATLYYAYSSSSMLAPTDFGSVDWTSFNGVGSGDFFGVQGEFLPGAHAIFVADGYVSGDFISGTSVFANTTLAEMNLAAGSYVWSWGGAHADTFTVNIVVPEPAHYAIGAGVAALALVALRRRLK